MEARGKNSLPPTETLTGVPVSLHTKGEKGFSTAPASKKGEAETISDGTLVCVSCMSSSPVTCVVPTIIVDATCMATHGILPCVFQYLTHSYRAYADLDTCAKQGNYVSKEVAAWLRQQGLPIAASGTSVHSVFTGDSVMTSFLAYMYNGITRITLTTQKQSKFKHTQ